MISVKNDRPSHHHHQLVLGGKEHHQLVLGGSSNYTQAQQRVKVKMTYMLGGSGVSWWHRAGCGTGRQSSQSTHSARSQPGWESCNKQTLWSKVNSNIQWVRFCCQKSWLRERLMWSVTGYLTCPVTITVLVFTSLRSVSQRHNHTPAGYHTDTDRVCTPLVNTTLAVLTNEHQQPSLELAALATAYAVYFMNGRQDRSKPA